MGDSKAEGQPAGFGVRPEYQLHQLTCPVPLGKLCNYPEFEFLICKMGLIRVLSSLCFSYKHSNLRKALRQFLAVQHVSHYCYYNHHYH